MTSQRIHYALLIGGVFAAQALWSHSQPLANAEQISDLTRELSTCPQLSPLVAQRMDDNGGHLSRQDIKEFDAQLEDCRSHYARLPEALEMRLAYQHLHRQFDQQTAQTTPGSHQPLSLSWQLGE